MSGRGQDRARALSGLAATFAGAVFALGLVLSGMTDTTKVRGFLDFTGRWDPSLAFVMVGAIGTLALARRWIVARGRPLARSSFAEPRLTAIDASLVVGAAAFGVGWGLSGVCPGPALASLAAGSAEAPLFVLAMAVGMGLHHAVTRAPQVARAVAAEHAPHAGRVDG